MSKLVFVGVFVVVDLDAPVNYTTVALVIGVSKQVARELAQRVKFSGGTVGELILAICARAREQAAGRGGDDMAELTRARIRESKSKALGNEIQNFEQLGLLVSVEEIEPALDQWAVVARSEVGNAINKIIGDIKCQFKIEIDQELLVDGHINAAYSIIGNYPGRNFWGRGDDIEGDVAASGVEVDSAVESSDAGVAA